jgi:hypothetical protein
VNRGSEQARSHWQNTANCSAICSSARLNRQPRFGARSLTLRSRGRPNGMAHWPSSAGACAPFCTCCPVRHAVGLPLNSNVRQRTRANAVRHQFQFKYGLPLRRYQFGGCPRGGQHWQLRLKQTSRLKAAQHSRPLAFAGRSFGAATDLTPAGRLNLRPGFEQPYSRPQFKFRVGVFLQVWSRRLRAHAAR